MHHACSNSGRSDFGYEATYVAASQTIQFKSLTCTNSSCLAKPNPRLLAKTAKNSSCADDAQIAALSPQPSRAGLKAGGT
mmetsp:Transcript_29807/g.74520  ORF Transcript_29807/g.74520 Transcript_29807/m.74520 type:complete len:80 (-) Transcript_29807:1551-1790(-)